MLHSYGTQNVIDNLEKDRYIYITLGLYDKAREIEQLCRDMCEKVDYVIPDWALPINSTILIRDFVKETK